MNLKSKLFIYLLSISMINIIVGLLFYFQLKNMIEPLTPKSIPLSIELLEKSINKSYLIDNLINQELLVEYNLENYVLTRNFVSLQRFYMNDSLLLKMLDQAKLENQRVRLVLDQKTQQLNILRKQILFYMQKNKIEEAKKIISSNNYFEAFDQIRYMLLYHSHKLEPYTRETAIATVKLAIKNSSKILQNSLTTTLIIFFDAVIAALLLAYFAANTISNPLSLLRNNIERMRVKNINIPINPQLLSLPGEIGDLSRSFSALIERLRSVTVLRDSLLTEIKQRNKLEKRLNVTAQNLQESNLELDQFAYVASHDLRAPLRAIEHLVNWIKEDCYDILPEKSQNNFDLIISRVTRLESLIKGMLDYYRAGKIPSKQEVVDINKLLNVLIESLYVPKNIQIIIDQTMPTMTTSESAISQVFLNLISNAIKHNDKPEGLIHIGYKILQNKYHFYVSDNGPGIDPQFHHKIYELFQTLRSRDTFESSGIGLAIVKKIIEKQNGEIWLKSSPGKGSTFYFTWPHS